MLVRPAEGFGPLLQRARRALADRGHAAREDGGASAALERLLDLAVVWNQRVDLTAARSAEELVDLYLADAMVLASASRELGSLPSSARWLDVGSGGGAPGLPLAVLMPEARMTAVEPRAKRVAFLRTALATLGTRGIEVRRARSEQLPSGACEVAVSRATLAPPLWLAEGTRLARRAVWVLLAHDEPPRREGWQAALDLRYAWPLTGVGRRAVCYLPTRQQSAAPE